MFLAPTDISEAATEHVRFSTASFEVIGADLIVSNTFVRAIFETILLEMIGTDLQGQQIVQCQNMTS